MAERKQIEFKEPWQIIEDRHATSFRLLTSSYNKLKELSTDYKMSLTGVVETLIRHAHYMDQTDAMANLLAEMQRLIDDVMQSGKERLTENEERKLYVVRDLVTFFETRQLWPKQRGKHKQIDAAIKVVKEKRK